MLNLLKMERYHLLHNSFYRWGLAGIILMGFLTAETYVLAVMGVNGAAARSLTDIFNGMIYDSTLLLIIISSILGFILGQEFSCRTIDQEICAGHSRREIFISKVISYLIGFNFMALLYPISGCIREYSRFGVAEPGFFFYNIVKGAGYSILANSAVFLIAVFICCCIRAGAMAMAVTGAVTFTLSLYLGYGMMLKLPVFFLPIYQIRQAVIADGFLVIPSIVINLIWIGVLISLSWQKFCKCDLK